MGNRKIIIADHAGFCFGVKRAVDMVEKCLDGTDKKVFSIGPVVHNNQVIEMLEKKGLVTVSSLDEIPDDGLLIIRSHGAPLEVIEGAKKRKIDVLDATCPFVNKARITAKNFYEKGYDVVICGDLNHAEVKGINSLIGNSGKIVGDQNEIEAIKFEKNTIGIMSQTTYKLKVLEESVGAMLARGIKRIMIENTICLDSTTKQNELKILVKEVDVVIVVGGKESSNTSKLTEISRLAGTDTYQIETASEIKKEWFDNKKRIAIAAGASTAKFIIDEVVESVKNI
jgi:(E)-4-hydroxy-3-methyl-but-2-enyl pyrophosphate reductase